MLLPGALARYEYKLGAARRARTPRRSSPRCSAPGPTPAGARRSPRDVQPQVTRVTDRLATFLTLAGLTALLTGGLGIALTIETHLARRTGTIATLKCLGASRRPGVPHLSRPGPAARRRPAWRWAWPWACSCRWRCGSCPRACCRSRPTSASMPARCSARRWPGWSPPSSSRSGRSRSRARSRRRACSARSSPRRAAGRGAPYLLLLAAAVAALVGAWRSWACRSRGSAPGSC